MPKNYGYGVKPVKASMSKKYGRARSGKKMAKKKHSGPKTVMSKSYGGY